MSPWKGWSALQGCSGVTWDAQSQAGYVRLIKARKFAAVTFLRQRKPVLRAKPRDRKFMVEKKPPKCTVHREVL